MFTVRGYQLNPDLYYDPHYNMWIEVSGGRARIGMDPLEQETKGAFVVVQMEAPGTELKRGDGFGSVEAEKHVGTLLTPLSGKIVSINQAVVENPRLVNTDPYGEGWFLELDLHQFEEEKQYLLTGEEALRQWYEEKIRKYEEWGWLAE